MCIIYRTTQGDKKAIINIKTTDNNGLEKALKSAMYPAKSHVNNPYSYYEYPDLNMDGINSPTPVTQIPKVEKKNNIAINVYGYNLSKKAKKLNIFPYQISERLENLNRINLLLVSENVEDENDEDECIIDDYDPDNED